MHRERPVGWAEGAAEKRLPHPALAGNLAPDLLQTKDNSPESHIQVFGDDAAGQENENLESMGRALVEKVRQ